jgi:DNA repair exonuclease SbcCD ATPase subunit
LDELDPIRQLQHLLDDPGKLLEKISSIHSTLGSISPADPTTAVEASASFTLGTDEPIQETQRYNRALESLRGIQAQLHERVLPLAHATAQAHIDQLRDRARRDHASMNDCLEQVDQRLLDCLQQVREAQRKYTELTTLNQKLESLGAPLEPLPELLPSANSVLESRLDALRRQGKI